MLQKIVTLVKGSPGLALLVTFFTITILPLRSSAEQQPQPSTATNHKYTSVDAMKALKDGEAEPYDLEVIGQANSVEAIPDLEKLFARTSDGDPMMKDKIAEVLIRLGSKNDAYWNYLASNAMAVVTSDAPGPFVFDSQGNTTGQSPAFAAWAKTHNTSVEVAFGNAEYVWPSRIMAIGATGDKRAIPILQRALSSPNLIIQLMAARGLAEFQDRGSVPLISDAVKKAPKRAGAAIAESLAYFDDPQAQEIATKYVSDEKIKWIRQQKATGHSALH
jgi:hypothetical protein